MEKPKVYFRADGNSQMGLGHVIRSLALAEMLREHFDCHFIIRAPLTTLKKQILAICSSITELLLTEDHLAEAQQIAPRFQASDIVVLDGYHFETAYQQTLKDRACKLVCIDDIYAYHFVADVVINHAPGIDSSLYSVESYTALYLGFHYALLRKPFRNSTQTQKNNTVETDRVLICLGGADPNNDTLEVLRICEQISDINNYSVVIGAAYNYLDQLHQFMKVSRLNIKLYQNILAEEMARLMSNSVIAITTPSTIAIEYLSIGGSLFLRKIAANQDRIFSYLVENKLAKAFTNTTRQLDKFSKDELTIQEKYFDGKQQGRFLKVFQELLLSIRPARPADMMLYFSWSNDTATRKQSFNSDPIPLEDHKVWFHNKLEDPNALLYVLELAQTPVAQVRFEVKAKVATISYAVDQNYRGRKLGLIALQKGIARFKDMHPNVSSIIGYVKNDNIASLKTFEHLNFQATPATIYQNTTQFSLS